MLTQLQRFAARSCLRQIGTNPVILVGLESHSTVSDSLCPSISRPSDLFNRIPSWSPASTLSVSVSTEAKSKVRRHFKKRSKEFDEPKLDGTHFVIEETEPASDKRIELIMGVFELPDELKAEALLAKYPKLKYQDEESILDMRNFLTHEGVSVSRFSTMPWIFTLPKHLVKEKADKVMQILGIDNFLASIPFLELSTYRLLELGSRWRAELKSVNSGSNEVKYKNRLEYLAMQLQCEQYEVADMMLKFPMLMAISFNTVNKKLQLLLDNDIRREDIVRDPYIFSHTAERIQARLLLTKHHGLRNVKPWLLRCIQATYDSYVDRLNQEQELLSGHKDIKSFLSQRLGCNSALVADILFRVPSVKRASASKLNEMIAFLYAQGFTADHILETPRILGHSVETVNQRIMELASYGVKLHTLFPLCQTTKNYNSFIRKIRGEAATQDE